MYLTRRSGTPAGRPVDANLDESPGLELALQNLLRQRIFDLLLDRAFQRSRTVHRVEACVSQFVARSIRQMDANVAIGQPLVQVAQLDIDDLANVLAAQRMEHDDDHRYD